MGYLYYINFSEKTEYTKHDNRLVPAPIGSLLFSVVDRDWDSLAERVAEQRRTLYRMDQVADSVEALRYELSDTHIFLQRDFERLTGSGDVLYAAYRWASEFASLRRQLTGLIGRVLDLDGEDSGLSVLQRYYLLNKTDPDARRFKQKMHEQLKVFQCMMCGEDEETLEVTRENVTDLEIEAAICYASDDLRTLVFMEFEYMVTCGYALRRCDNCGLYFMPFSVVSRYCDRPAGDGKTCKDLAVRERYNEKLRANICRATYVKSNNAYQMRVRRSPEQYTAGEYAAWKTAARTALDALESGSISEETCLRAVSLPDRREQAGRTEL